MIDRPIDVKGVWWVGGMKGWRLASNQTYHHAPVNPFFPASRYCCYTTARQGSQPMTLVGSPSDDDDEGGGDVVMLAPVNHAARPRSPQSPPVIACSCVVGSIDWRLLRSVRRSLFCVLGSVCDASHSFTWWTRFDLMCDDGEGSPLAKNSKIRRRGRGASCRMCGLQRF